MSLSRYRCAYWRADFEVAGERHNFVVKRKDGTLVRSKREAKAIEEAARVEARAQAARASSSPEAWLIGDAVELSLRGVSKDDRHFANRVRYAQAIVEFFGADTPVDEIDEASINVRFVEWLQQRPIQIYRGGSSKPSERGEAGLWGHIDRRRSVSTINRYLDALRRTLKLCEGVNLKNGRPALLRAPKVNKLRELEHMPRPMPDDHVDKLLAVLPGYLNDAVRIALLTGLRKAEVFGLRADQVNIEARTIRLDAARTKGKRDEIIRCPSDAMTLLERLVAEARQDGRDFLIAYRRPAKKDAKKLPPARPVRNPKKAWQSALRAAGLPPYRFHDLRATYITNVATMPLSSAAMTRNLARHRDQKTTDRYLKVADAALWAVVDGLS
ncbi:MAG: tyrosine-type recombinase/integrase, partial [Hyphomonadaceae bacterium]